MISFAGYNKNKQNEYEKYVESKGARNASKLIEDSKKYLNSLDPQKKDGISMEFDSVNKKLTEKIQQKIPHTANDVQDIIEEHYQLISRFYTVTKEIYRGLGTMYTEHDDFLKTFRQYHPELATYLKDAMNTYSDANL